jgi:hypothetical protein
VRGVPDRGLLLLMQQAAGRTNRRHVDVRSTALTERCPMKVPRMVPPIAAMPMLTPVAGQTQGEPRSAMPSRTCRGNVREAWVMVNQVWPH